MWYKAKSRVVSAVNQRKREILLSPVLALLLLMASLLVSCRGGGERRPPEFGGFELADSPWPKVNADLRNTRHVEGTPITDPEIAWVREIEGRVAFEPVIAGDKLIVVTWNPFKILAISLSNGSVEWQRYIYIISPLLVTKQGIITLSQNRLFFFNNHGQIVQSVILPIHLRNPVLTLFNGFIVILDDNYLLLVDMENNDISIRFRNKALGRVFNPLSTSDIFMYYNYNGGQIVLFDPLLGFERQIIDDVKVTRYLSINDCNIFLSGADELDIMSITDSEKITRNSSYPISKYIGSYIPYDGCDFLAITNSTMYLVNDNGFSYYHLIPNLGTSIINDLVINRDGQIVLIAGESSDEIINLKLAFVTINSSANNDYYYTTMLLPSNISGSRLHVISNSDSIIITGSFNDASLIISVQDSKSSAARRR